MSFDPTTAPSDGSTRPTATVSGVTSLLGRVVAGVAVVAAGVGGWVAVDQFDIGLPVAQESSTNIATALPSLGDGLPAARLQSPAPRRQFTLTSQSAERTTRFWIDLDGWQLRIETTGPDGDQTIEIQGDRSFTRADDGVEWVEHDAEATRNVTAWLMADVGPYVLTDLVPPHTSGFTTLELEGTSRGERVYEVSIDSETLREQHPLAHERWANAVRLVGASTGVYRIRVREDGYIARIDGESASVEWDDLVGGVVFFSPLDGSEPATGVPGPDDDAVGEDAVGEDGQPEGRTRKPAADAAAED